ncbi:MAG: hypothetical protein K8F25_13280 [Fimbriimonadaceae bacterium]|nr:hypothetical protein [Alphaproteobacteria bacterium]
MSLTPVKVINPFEFHVRRSEDRTRTFKYEVGRVVEMHPYLVSKLEADGYVSTDTNAALTDQERGDKSFELVTLSQTDREALETMDISSVEHRLIYALANLSGDVEMRRGDLDWIETAKADAAIATGAAVQLRWPEPTPERHVKSWTGAANVTVTV